MLAKVFALIGIGAIYGLISLIGSVGRRRRGAWTLIDRPLFPSSEVVRSLALSLLVLGLWALIGLGIGILIPNQVAALLIGIGVAWIVEPLLGLALGAWEFGREHIVGVPALPGHQCCRQRRSRRAPDAVRLEWWGGALVLLAAYAVALAGFGIWRTSRADISSPAAPAGLLHGRRATTAGGAGTPGAPAAVVRPPPPCDGVPPTFRG